MRQHAMSIPGRPKSGPSFPTTCKHNVPRNQRDQAIAEALSARFRAGGIYAYAYERGTWSTWASEADWLATERNGQVRGGGCHGPTDWPRDALITWLGLDTAHAGRPKRPGKADYVAMLRRIYEGSDWEVTELEALLAAA